MYKPIIGLEIHCELKTQSKMFCGCPNDPDETRPNFNVCPICLGHPGTLPVINQEAVKSVLKLGLALGGKILAVSHFDRKSYFYPDLPKGYQISQYKQPLVEGGNLMGVKITRIHLEEDTASLSHNQENYSLVDFNRAGIPLMELVTEPDIKNAEQAVSFAKELQLILRYLGISEARMEQKQMRIEVNLSLRPNGEKLGTKVEIKNLNSFKTVQEAIDYEIKRQTEILEKGEKIIQETRGWDDAKKVTVSQRFKEESHDYRYFPEPDLPPLELSRFDLDNFKKVELPAEKRKRFEKDYGLGPAVSEIFIEDIKFSKYFEEAASRYYKIISKNGFGGFGTLYNYLVSDLRGIMSQEGVGIDDLKIGPEDLAQLAAIIDRDGLSSRIAKDVLKEMFLTGQGPEQIIREKGLGQISDEETIKKAIIEAIKENPKAVADYKKGKENALQFLVGQVMKKFNGQANPDILRKLFEDFLSK